MIHILFNTSSFFFSWMPAFIEPSCVHPLLNIVVKLYEQDTPLDFSNFV